MAERFDLRHGDSREVLKGLSEGSVDALVTDPPAGIGFMGKDWDTFGRSNPRAQDDREAAYDKIGKGASPFGYSGSGRVNGDRDRFIAAIAPIFAECLRVLKPGAHGLVWALPRTSHWTATALEDGGFEIRDRVSHLFGTGFPKSLNLDGGLGTALKPACEDWWLVRKPLEGTVAANAAAHGTGALNIDGCRIGTGADKGDWPITGRAGERGSMAGPMRAIETDRTSGRWPANVTLDEEAAALLDEQSGESVSAGGSRGAGGQHGALHPIAAQPSVRPGLGDTGGASRFFYVAKPDRAERDIGCEDLAPATGGEATARVDGTAGLQNPRAGAGRNGGARNIHPTVKSVDLMRWLCRLITPKGGLVLDPFMGSGSTGVACSREGLRFIGIERERAYFEIAKRRICGDAPLLNSHLLRLDPEEAA